MPKVQFQLHGFDEFKKVLEALPERVEKRVLQNATYAGARVGRAAIKKAAPRHKEGEQSPASKLYGPLWKNIRMSKLRRVRRGEKAARIHTGNAFWGFIREKGSRYIPAQPWFLPAFQGAINAMLEAMASNMGRGIEREAAKLAKEKGSI